MLLIRRFVRCEKYLRSRHIRINLPQLFSSQSVMKIKCLIRKGFGFNLLIELWEASRYARFWKKGRCMWVMFLSYRLISLKKVIMHSDVIREIYGGSGACNRNFKKPVSGVISPNPPHPLRLPLCHIERSSNILVIKHLNIQDSENGYLSPSHLPTCLLMRKIPKTALLISTWNRTMSCVPI